MRRTTLVFALSLLLPVAVARAGGDPEAGEALAARLCSACHAISGHGAPGPVAKAPPFASFAAKWPLEHLEEALAEGIVVGHGGERMPEFRLEPEQIADLIAYLETLSR